MELVGLVAEAVVWVALAVLAYTYAGYPLAIWLLARLFGKEHAQEDAEPTVSLLIPAHNEAGVIRAKVENSLALDYPRGKLQVRVVSDGSSDGTDETVRAYEARGVELQRIEVRAGKPNALNQAVPFARGEILVLCDANTMFASDAVRRLVRHFADPQVGAVTGDVRLRSEDVGYGEGEGLFYRLERFIQQCESRFWTTIGVDGGMYALRRELYVPNRPDTLIDDFVIAMNVARTGSRVIYDPAAIATEDAVENPAQEFRRRARTTAGGFQTLLEGRGRPRLTQPRFWFGYLSHKVLRWTSPFFLMLLFFGSIAGTAAGGETGWRWSFQVGLLGLQLAFFLLAMVGAGMRRRRLPGPVCLPYYFGLTNLAAIAGFVRWLRGSQSVVWAHADRTSPASGSLRSGDK